MNIAAVIGNAILSIWRLLTFTLRSAVVVAMLMRKRKTKALCPIAGIIFISLQRDKYYD
jgi:hypothetical protein